MVSDTSSFNRHSDFTELCPVPNDKELAVNVYIGPAE